MGKTQQYLDEYCEKGLRTLALAFREISEEEYIQWGIFNKYNYSYII